jgi:hypothetical protein
MTWKKLVSLVPTALRSACFFLGLALVWSASSGFAFGRGTPEIDPGSATSALALLTGGLLLLKPRFGRK